MEKLDTLINSGLVIAVVFLIECLKSFVTAYRAKNNKPEYPKNVWYFVVMMGSIFVTILTTIISGNTDIPNFISNFVMYMAYSIFVYQTYKPIREKINTWKNSSNT